MEKIADLLGIIAILLVFIILILVCVYVWMVHSSKKKKEEKKEPEQEDKKKYTSTGLPKESIYSFMEFDDIRDNMIVRKNGEQYVMAIACQGVNYDLMSEEEKMSVEEGFVQFLNTLKFPIQLYVQTRTLNLRDIVAEYKDKVDTLQNEIDRIDVNLREAQKKGDKDEIADLDFRKRRKQNILEYGTDITEYVERLSANRNVLQQKTYVIVSYYAVEAGNLATYSPEEKDNICFSELYTRCQAIIRSLAASEVIGRVIDSEELAELLYVAYDRESSEILQLSKALDAQYDAIYATGKDVLQKRMEVLEEELNAQAVELATHSIIEANKAILKKQQEEQTVEQRALEIIEQYKDQMNEDLFEETKEQINQSAETKRKRKSKKTEEQN